MLALLGLLHGSLEATGSMISNQLGPGVQFSMFCRLSSEIRWAV